MSLDLRENHKGDDLIQKRKKIILMKELHLIKAPFDD